MMSKEAMKLALEALEGIHPGNMTPMAEEYWNKAITALQEALAEQPAPVQQEPVATDFKSPGQRWEDGDDHDPRSDALYKYISDIDFKHCGDSFCFTSGGDGDNGETLMFILDCWFAQQSTSPQPAQRKPLTDEEIEKLDCVYPLWDDGESCTIMGIKDFARAIEATHNIKEQP